MLDIEVGNRDIKAAPRMRRVTVNPGGVVADYAPFYFAPQSPMLYSISRGNVPTYSQGTGRLVFLVSTVERLVDMGLTVLISDRNARNLVTKFQRLDDARTDNEFVDWELMRAQYWVTTRTDASDGWRSASYVRPFPGKPSKLSVPGARLWLMK